MHGLPLDQVPHRIIAGNRQFMLLLIEGIDQVKEYFGLEVGRLQFVNIIPEEANEACLWRIPILRCAPTGFRISVFIRSFHPLKGGVKRTEYSAESFPRIPLHNKR